MPSSHAPVDDNVKIPQAVLDAAARAEAHYAKAPETPVQTPPPAGNETAAPKTGDAPINVVATPAPDPTLAPRPLLQPGQVDPVAPVQVQPVVVPTPEELKSVDFAAEYNSMRGRWQQSQQIIGGMQEQMIHMGRELERLSAERERRPPPETKKLITPEDEKTYGTELIDLVQRAARQAVTPDIEAARQESQRATQRATASAQADVHRELDREVPSWREINTDPHFLSWLSLRDLYSGQVRQGLLNQAFAAASAPRVLQFFKGYLAEAQATGQLPAPTAAAASTAPTREAALKLDTLVAPGRALPASGTDHLPPDKPIITHKQIAEFYSQKGISRYIGRAADRKADEEMIFEAQREGRVR